MLLAIWFEKDKSNLIIIMGAVRIRHSIREIATQPVILWILLGGKPKWLPLNFGFNDVMRMVPIASPPDSFSIHPRRMARWRPAEESLAISFPKNERSLVSSRSIIELRG